MVKNIIPILVASACSFAAAKVADQKQPAPETEVKAIPAAQQFPQIIAIGHPQAVRDGEKTSGYSLINESHASGLWVMRDYKAPFAALYSIREEGGYSVLGFSRDQNIANRHPGHDFAIVASRKEVYFQIKDDKGRLHFIPTSALLKLEEKK